MTQDLEISINKRRDEIARLESEIQARQSKLEVKQSELEVLEKAFSIINQDSQLETTKTSDSVIQDNKSDDSTPTDDSISDVKSLESENNQDGTAENETAEDKPKSLRELGFNLLKNVEAVVKELSGEISQPRVSKILKERFPDVAPSLQNSSVTTTLRTLSERDVLKKIRDEHGSDPKVYMKPEEITDEILNGSNGNAATDLFESTSDAEQIEGDFEMK